MDIRTQYKLAYRAFRVRENEALETGQNYASHRFVETIQPLSIQATDAAQDSFYNRKNTDSAGRRFQLAKFHKSNEWFRRNARWYRQEYKIIPPVDK